VLPEPTQVIEVQPGACPCGQREFPETTSYYTHQVIELPPIQMQGTHVILHETRCSECGRLLKTRCRRSTTTGMAPG
jgi:transposase